MDWLRGTQTRRSCSTPYLSVSDGGSRPAVHRLPVVTVEPSQARQHRPGDTRPDGLAPPRRNPKDDDEDAD
jgi:hypothetical protein